MLRYKQLINLTVAVNYLFVFFFFFGSSLHILCNLYHIMQSCHLCFLKTSQWMDMQCRSPSEVIGKSFNKHNPIQMYISHEKHVQSPPPCLTLLGKDACGTHMLVWVWYNLKEQNAQSEIYLLFAFICCSWILFHVQEGTVLIFLQDYLHVC